MANLSVPDDSVSPWKRPEGATYLVFEILYSDPDDNSKSFNPYVSQELFSSEDTPRAASSFIRALKNLRENNEKQYLLHMHQARGYEGTEQSRAVIKSLIARYEQTNIPLNMAATAVIHQAWTHGNIRTLSGTTIAEGLFIQKRLSATDRLQPIVLEHMAAGLGFKSWRLGETMIDGQIWVGELADEQHQWIEFSLIHKTTTNNIDQFTLIHYPIILYGYWFIGFAYTFKVGPVPDVEIFRRNKYKKCLSVLAESSALTLKRGLISHALDKIEWGETVSRETIVRAARLYMSCFDFTANSEGEAQTSFRRYISYPELNLRMYAPDWVVSDATIRESIAAELTHLVAEIHKRHKEVMYLREKERADIGAGLFHNLVHYTLPLVVYSRNIPRYLRRNDRAAANSYSVYVNRGAERMAGFVSAVQAYIKPTNELHLAAVTPLTKLPAEALLVQVEAINASAHMLSRDYNSPVPVKYGLLLGNLFGCDYKTVKGQRQLQRKLRAIKIEQPKVSKASLKKLTEWLVRLGLDIRVEGGEEPFSLLQGDFNTMVVVMEELLLNAMEAAARAKRLFRGGTSGEVLPDVTIEAKPGSLDGPSQILIHNWSDEPLGSEQLDRPVQDKGWGLYGMRILMNKMGGSLELINKGPIGARLTPPYRVGYKITLQQTL